jgi:hypothetical protein
LRRTEEDTTVASILNNLKKVHAAVVAQRVTSDESAIGAALNRAAVAAVTGGIRSDAWKSYMAVFASNPEQLERLTVEKPGESPYLAQMRAYIVSNAICDAGTNAFTNNKVTKAIDGLEGVAENPLISDEVSDPDGTVAALRPADLKAIPDVTI